MTQGKKVAIVTGASRGIGKAICIELARHGYAVVVAARSTTHKEVTPWPGTIHETAEEVNKAGGSALPVRMDLTSMDDVRNVVDVTMKEFGRIDVLVNDARYVGEGYVAMFLDTSWEALDQMISTNLRAVLLLHKLCLPVMIDQGGGVIINLTTGEATRESPHMPGQGGTGLGYPITKAAAERFVHMSNKEHGTKMVATRIFNVYGPGQLDKSGKLVTNTIRRALAGKDLVIFGEGSQEIDFIHVDDAAALIVAALERAERGEVTDVVDIGTGVGTTVKDAVETIRRVSGSSSNVVHQEERSGDAQQRIVADPTRMHWPDGFEPRQLVLGIKETVEAAR